MFMAVKCHKNRRIWCSENGICGLFPLTVQGQMELTKGVTLNSTCGYWLIRTYVHEFRFNETGGKHIYFGTSSRLDTTLMYNTTWKLICCHRFIIIALYERPFFQPKHPPKPQFVFFNVYHTMTYAKALFQHGVRHLWCCGFAEICLLLWCIQSISKRSD